MGSKKETVAKQGARPRKLKLNKETVRDLAVGDRGAGTLRGGNVRHSEWVGKVWVNC